MLNVNIAINLSDGEQPSPLEQGILEALAGQRSTEPAQQVFNLSSAVDTEFDRMVKLAQEFDTMPEEPVNGTPDASPTGPHLHSTPQTPTAQAKEEFVNKLAEDGMLPEGTKADSIPDDQDIAEQEADEPEDKPEPPKKAAPKRRATATRRKAAPKKAAEAPQEDEDAADEDEPTQDDSDAAEAQQEPEDETPAVLEDGDADEDTALEDAVSKATGMVRNGKRDIVKAALKAVDVARVSELTPDKVEAFLDELGE